MVIRKLKAPDLFTFSKMLNKMGLREDISNLLKAPKEEDEKETGGIIVIKLVILLMENLYKAETEFYEFVSPVIEKSVEEIREMDLKEIKEIINAIIKDEGAMSFFT